MRHKESELQIRCVRWFRVNYPQFALLLEHPRNEGGNGRTKGAIAKAEGVTPGVADLILHLPAHITPATTTEAQRPAALQECPAVLPPGDYHSLAVELKTPSGRQSPGQRMWQRYFQAAGGLYVVVRSFDEFAGIVTAFMQNVPLLVFNTVCQLHVNVRLEETEAARREMNQILNKR